FWHRPSGHPRAIAANSTASAAATAGGSGHGAADPLRQTGWLPGRATTRDLLDQRRQLLLRRSQRLGRASDRRLDVPLIAAEPLLLVGWRLRESLGASLLALRVLAIREQRPRQRVEYVVRGGRVTCVDLRHGCTRACERERLLAIHAPFR